MKLKLKASFTLWVHLGGSHCWNWTFFLSDPTHSILIPAAPDWWSWKHFCRWPYQRNSMWWAIEVQDVGPPGSNPLLDNSLVGKAGKTRPQKASRFCCCYRSLRSCIVEVGVGRFPTACKVMNVFISWKHPVLLGYFYLRIIIEMIFSLSYII